jgi:hypothetical protein
LGPLADDIPLKLCQSAEDVEDQLPAGGRRVDRLSDRTESDPTSVQSGHGLDEVLQGPPQPIEPPDNDRVAFA